MPSIFTSGIFTIVFEVRITNIPISFQSEIDEFGRQLTDMKFATLSLVWLTALSCVSSDLYLRRSEDSEVAICEQFDVCNLVHNPKWGINSVEKLCKCSEGSFCPTNFSPNDGSSLLVNARTQMKFCTPLSELQSELEMCDENEIAIQVKTVYQIDQVQNVSASILCNCNHHGPNYWKYNSRVGQFVAENEKLFEVLDNYQCSELPKCNTNEFCGFARIDFGFIFQRCTCDEVHDCKYFVDESEVEEEIDSELFYSGLMYKSRCIHNESFEHW